MILKEIGRKIAQVFRSAKAADEKVASSIAETLDAKAEQLREYEKSFGPEPPEPDSLMKANESLAAAGIESSAAATYELRRFAESLKPKPRSNNWRKMHGLPMRRKMPKQRRR